MATIQTFEEIEAWKRARKLAHELHTISLREAMKYDFALRDQVNRSTGSVMDNIAEGFERGGNREFIQFLYIAKGSTGEARSQLYRMLDRNYVTDEEYARLSGELRSTSQLLMNFISYLKSADLKGSKYHDPETCYISTPSLILPP